MMMNDDKDKSIKDNNEDSINEVRNIDGELFLLIICIEYIDDIILVLFSCF